MKITFLTDIHIGNPKINLSRIVDSLHTYAWPELETSQLILLGGDFFDCLLNINSDAGIMAIYIIDELINLALEKKIYLRVLRGTFSHDRYQNRLFVERAKEIPSYGGVALIRSIDKIEIERFALYDLTVLFCPDDQPQKDVTQAILDVMNSSHMDQVDYMCCHGYWDHLLPDNSLVKPHDCLDYERIKSRVKYQIFNGHVHTPGIWHKVISGGSFERFRHAEEEDKGFYTAEYDNKKHTSTIKFIRNKRAVPFISIDMSIEQTQEKALAYLDRRVRQELQYYPDNDVPIHVRIIGDYSALAKQILDQYPKAIITEKHNGSKKQEEVDYSSSINDLPVITIDNLPQMIYDNVKEKHPEMTIERIKEILNDTRI